MTNESRLWATKLQINPWTISHITKGTLRMTRTAKLATTLAALALAVTALAGCASPSATTTAETPAATAAPAQSEPTPSPTHLTELPEWAQENGTWLVYPDGFECSGTEGCPNDYRATFGEPGDVLPEGVEYYNPEEHDCVLVAPAGADCMG